MWDQSLIRQAIASTCAAHAQQQCGFASRSSESSAVAQECLRRAETIPPRDLILMRNTAAVTLEISNPPVEILEYQRSSLGLHSITLGQNLSRSILGNPPNCDQFRGTGAAQTNRGVALSRETDQKKTPAKMEVAHSWIQDFNTVSLHTTSMGSSISNPLGREIWMKKFVEKTNFNDVLIVLGGLCLAALSVFGLFSPGTINTPLPQQQLSPAGWTFWPTSNTTPRPDSA